MGLFHDIFFLNQLTDMINFKLGLMFVVLQAMISCTPMVSSPTTVGWRNGKIIHALDL